MIIEYNKVQEDIMKFLANKTLIPIIGSGFSAGAKTKYGVVPNGEEYKKHMVLELCKYMNDDSYIYDELIKDTFSNIASEYNEMIEKEDRKKYLKDNFFNVYMQNKSKLKFLKINWPYIYTLNIDDCIEKNSAYKQVVSINRTVDENIYNEEKCVIKLHGDISQYITYSDEKIIFSQDEYLSSLEENVSLLNRVKYDMKFSNIIYIGASLDDEIDLLFSVNDAHKNETVKVNRYYCTIHKPNLRAVNRLKRYGISHIIVFDSYDEIYNQLYTTWENSTKNNIIDASENIIKTFKTIKKPDFNSNIEYLLRGKNIKSQKQMALLPYFFINREQTQNIINQLNDKSVIIIKGGSYSGKTYMLWDFVHRIRSKTVYSFQSEDRLSDAYLNELLKKHDTIFVFDSKCLNNNQTSNIFKGIGQIRKNNNTIVIFTDLENREIFGTINLMKMDKNPYIKYVSDDIFIKKYFYSNERSILNKKMAECNFPIFKRQSNLDNIIYIAQQLNEECKFLKYHPLLNTEKDIAVLITLAIKKKVYDYECIIYDFYDEIQEQVKQVNPLIAKETTFNFERSNKDRSSYKYVVNADYWLKYVLEQFASEENYNSISNAYKYIMKQLIFHYGEPDLEYSSISDYREFIYFNNINEIFSMKKDEGILLIKMIYDSLSDLLRLEPNFKHQRAKCYIRCAKIMKSSEEKRKLLQDAFHFVTSSISIFKMRFSKTGNLKVKISLDHAMYTMAVIQCHLCTLDSYRNKNDNSIAVDMLYKAFLSPNNSFTFAEQDDTNFDNVVSETINKLVANQSLICEDKKSYLEYLMNKKREYYIQ